MIKKIEDFIMAKLSKSEMHKVVLWILIIFSVIVVGFVLTMNFYVTQLQQENLEDAISGELVSISASALDRIDPVAFEKYNSVDDVMKDEVNYKKTLSQLRHLCTSMGADYIYALKEVNGEYVFVFDTDPIDEEIFIPYELSPVHEDAFNGISSASLMNVDDEYGSFNTGAVPIYKGDKVIGIIATDMADHHIEKSLSAARNSAILLAIVLGVLMLTAIITIYRLFNRVQEMQKRLSHIAHHDTVTGLPNRQYLLEQLEERTQAKKNEPFAIFFVDLDNFKKVNDNAGHEAGDEALRAIANFLNKSLYRYSGKSFRPAAGSAGLSTRIGGDEFVIVIPGIDRNKAEAIAIAILDDYEREDFIDPIKRYNVSLSIGIALYPDDSKDYNMLIKMADAAMYVSKKEGKRNYRLFDPVRDAAAIKED